MKIKIVIILAVLLGILFLSLFDFSFKEKITRELVQDVSEYICDENNFCTLCMIDGEKCDCGQHICECGGKTVNKERCVLF